MSKQEVYQVAVIAYNPNDLAHPWCVLRAGTVAEQGGLAFGSETAHFVTIEDALNVLRAHIERDVPKYQEKIAKLRGGGG